MKLTYIVVAVVALIGLSANACEKEAPVERICKGKAEAACTQDPRCTWKLPDEPDGVAKCKERA